MPNKYEAYVIALYISFSRLHNCFSLFDFYTKCQFFHTHTRFLLHQVTFHLMILLSTQKTHSHKHAFPIQTFAALTPFASHVPPSSCLFYPVLANFLFLMLFIKVLCVKLFLNSLGSLVNAVFFVIQFCECTSLIYLFYIAFRNSLLYT